MTWNPTSGTKPCGCGPLQPCEPHRDTGEVLDWEGRARAAEDRLDALEDALRRHTYSFTDPKGSGELCGGCLQPSPCEDTKLLGEPS